MTSYDTPLNHGWRIFGKSDIDGAIIFDLDGIAQMKQSINEFGLWYVNIKVGDKWEGMISQQDLADLTITVKIKAGIITNN